MCCKRELQYSSGVSVLRKNARYRDAWRCVLSARGPVRSLYTPHPTLLTLCTHRCLAETCTFRDIVFGGSVPRRHKRRKAGFFTRPLPKLGCMRSTAGRDKGRRLSVGRTFGGKEAFLPCLAAATSAADLGVVPPGAVWRAGHFLSRGNPL